MTARTAAIVADVNAAAWEWAWEWLWANLDTLCGCRCRDVPLVNLSDRDARRVVAQHYVGGWSAFLREVA